MDRPELEKRTREFAVRIIRLCRELGNMPGEGWAIRDQLVRCGTAVAANYRAACRSRSTKEFAARLGVVLEEADETLFWLELVGDAEIVPRARLTPLMHETEELVRIFATARRTTLTKSKIVNRKSEICSRENS